MDSAAQSGSVPVLRFLIKEDCSINYETYACAARNGCIPVLEFLLEEEGGEAWYGWLDEAAMNGHLNVVLQWAADHDDQLGTIDWNDHDICSSAAQSGSIEVMQFLQQRGANFAEHNVTSDSNWARDSITTAAARSESKEVLLWLKQQNILPTVHAMCESARLDMLNICLFLHTECSCPWDASVLSSAASNGVFETVQALYDRGCPIDVHAVCSAAARHGRVDVLEYLLQLPDQSQWTAKQLTALLNLAGINEHLAVAKWLRQQGAEWPTVLGDTTEKWQGKLLQWARRTGCTSPLAEDPAPEDSP
jgi:hypothetical protein